MSYRVEHLFDIGVPNCHEELIALRLGGTAEQSYSLAVVYHLETGFVSQTGKLELRHYLMKDVQVALSLLFLGGGLALF